MRCDKGRVFLPSFGGKSDVKVRQLASPDFFVFPEFDSCYKILECYH